MLRTLLLYCIFFLAVLPHVAAQGHLDKTVTITVSNAPLGNVLKKIGEKNNFYFSYNSNIIRQDSLVSLSVQGQTVRQVLQMLFADKFEYTEKNKYIIIERAGSQFWYISGYVFDENTQERLRDVSIYEEQQLTAALTNDQGYFRLKLKKNPETNRINIRKSWYTDTVIVLRPGVDQEIKVGIAPKNIEMDAVVITPYVEKSWLAKFFLSSKQRAQSLNLNKFFVDKPYQASVIPGFSTHGKMGAQVVNKFSFNMLGGYTAGVNGFEIGGIFNIVKKDVRYAQVGGVFNIVGGAVNGIQIGGVYNHAMDTISGIQIGGVANYVNGKVDGVQIAGVYNHVTADMGGLQIAGVSNYIRDELDGAQIAGVSNLAVNGVDGTQISGVCNFTYGDMDGVQITGVVNYARNLKGVQIGLINLSDTTSGYSIGLVNFSVKGYHKLCIYSNEVTNINAAFKTGSKKFYTMLIAGHNISEVNSGFSFGYGLGKEIALSKTLALNPEISAQHIFLGDWEHLNMLYKTELHFTVNINKYFALFAGPSYTFYYSDQTVANEGYKFELPGKGYSTQDLGNSFKGWIGGSAGISFF